jgi:hypothetical protein
MVLSYGLFPLGRSNATHSKLTVRLHDPSIIAAQLLDGLASNMPAREGATHQFGME